MQISPFYHGVRLMQLTAWGEWRPMEIALHVGILLLFTIVLGYIAMLRVEKKLTA